MLRKISVFLTAFFILLSMNVYGETEIQTVSKEDMYDNIVINISNSEKNGWLTVRVYAENGEQLCFMDQARIKDVNTFTYTLTPERKRYESYTVEITRSTGGTVNKETKEFSYYTYEQKSNAINEVIASGSISEKNAEILSVNIGETGFYYYLSDKSKVIDRLKQISGLKPENFAENFEKCVIAESYMSKDADMLKKLFTKYSDTLFGGNEYSDFTEWYENYADTSFFERMALKAYESEEEFKEEFCAQSFLYALKNKHFSELETFLAKYNGKISQNGEALNLNDISNLSSKYGTNKAETVMYNISGVLYDSLKDFKTKYDTEINSIKNNNNDDSDNNKGSGGSVSGSVSNSAMAGGISVVKEPTQNTAEKQKFDDISVTPWAAEAINALYEKGVVNGMGNNKFEPQLLVTREQFAKIAVLAFEITSSGETAVFSDAVDNSWYIPYISICKNSGIMIGRQEAFGIGECITREDLAVVLYRILLNRNPNITVEKNDVFNDSAEISSYAKDAVNTLYSLGIINGNGSGGFSPKTFATRAESAKLVYSLIQYLEQAMVIK